MAGTTNYNIPLVPTPNPSANPHGQAALLAEANYADVTAVNEALQAIDTLLKAHFG
jgi:hypothetical protein